MEVENQQQFEEMEEGQQKLDTSEESEEVLIEQRGDDALENQDEIAVDQEVLSGEVKVEEDIDDENEPPGGVDGEPAELDLLVHDPDHKEEQEGKEEKETGGVGGEPAELDLLVHDPDHKEEQEEKEEEETEIHEESEERKIPADLELMVHDPDSNTERSAEVTDGTDDQENRELDDEEEDNDDMKGSDDELDEKEIPQHTDLDDDITCIEIEDAQEDMHEKEEQVLEADDETAGVDLVVQSPEVLGLDQVDKEQTDLDLMVHDPDEDKETIQEMPKKPERKPAGLEMLVQKDENDNDGDAEPETIHRNGDNKPKVKTEMKTKPKTGSVKNSIAKFNSESKKDKGIFMAVQHDKCSACEKTVYAMEKLEMNKNIYHRGCFKCSHCSATLTAKTFSINEGVIYCTTHFKQLFARKGNYDEGFGRQQYKKKWTEEQLKKKDSTA